MSVIYTFSRDFIMKAARAGLCRELMNQQDSLEMYGPVEVGAPLKEN
jgi:hypothetical protein